MSADTNSLVYRQLRELAARDLGEALRRQGASQMATSLSNPAVTIAAAPAPSAPAAQTIVCTSAPDLSQQPLAVLLVGAGGTGARIVPPLMQMLKPTDILGIIDHDIVEDRNLRRQHFVAADIGRYKAEVLASRYRRAGAATIIPFVAPLRDETSSNVLTELGDARRPLVIIGAVDNAEARIVMHRTLFNNRRPTAWIDVGNERRAGQVILSLSQWMLTVIADGVRMRNANWTLPGLSSAMPQLLKVAASWDCMTCGLTVPRGQACSECGQPEASCARIDFQTVMVNALAASCAINTLSWLLYQIPFATCGAFFSTLNTMQAIPIVQADTARSVLTPSTTFADPA